MESEYIAYAKELDHIGDLLNKASIGDFSFEKDEVHTLKELESRVCRLTISADRYRAISNNLSKIKAPKIVLKHHEELLGGVNSFVHGITLMKDSINVIAVTTNYEQLMQGDAIRIIGVGAVGRSTQKIGDILEIAITKLRL